MSKSFNLAQSKLLANFSSDLAKGLLLAGASSSFISRENLIYRWLITLLCTLTAIFLLNFALNILKGVDK